ncbi:hypothetical protein O181_080875 [Austropuccinia psidii MF-1]|uniref:Uncharacterized protein n=1 Tax=Austropuccinia psidii MF-1 TaxID=1389203 RepID=A0A9Q3FP05_9BASI|nr:hypothetical protein [Austropuccinia psidii MF-1]
MNRKQPCGSSSSLQKQEYSSASPKDKSERKAKGKEKGKIQVEQALPTELQNFKERKYSHGKCIQYGNKSDGIQKQGGRENEPIVSKEIDLVKYGLYFETCNKEILAKLNNLEYIQQKLSREILEVKEPQKTIIGLESVNKDNILRLTHIYERIESKVTLLNQNNDNCLYFIKKQLKQLIIQVQNLKNSTGHNAALFQEQLEKGDNARLELKEDIQSSINNTSLKNEFQRKSIPILDRNMLNLNNDLHHKVSRNAEVEATFNFNNIPRLKESLSFSGEGEYNHMEFMKTMNMFKEDFSIPDEYISARLHSLFTRSAKKWYYKMRQDHGKYS